MSRAPLSARAWLALLERGPRPPRVYNPAPIRRDDPRR